MVRPLPVHLFHALVLSCSLLALLQAQPAPRGVVRGRVLDDSTNAPLPLANIFLSNSTMGTAANTQGRFELKGIPLGNQQVVASIVGYQPGSISLQLTDSIPRYVELRLKARPVQMSAVEIEARDPVEWKTQLERFTKAFFGSTSNSVKCKVTNAEVLDFTLEEGTGQFIATAREPLEIVNAALGYRFQCILQFFIETPHTFRYIGLTGFQHLQPQSTEVAEQWKTNRRTAFYGSKRHFLLSLFRKTARQEGFEVNSIRSDWVRTALIRPVGFEVNPDTLLAPSDVPFEKKLSFPDLLQIIFTRGSQRQFSIIELSGPSVMIFSNGFAANPLGLWTYGFWSSQRVAEMLPLDYEPD